MNKHEFTEKPATFSENWPGEISSFSWQDFLTAIPSPLFLATTYKENGRENACLQSWSTFLGVQGTFVCILGSVSREHGHFYKSLKQRGGCVLNFPSVDVYERCHSTIANNGWDTDEITQSGLCAQKAKTVDAPRIADCFLNIECTLLWEHELFPGSDQLTLALKATHICMDVERCKALERYSESGYLYNINAPRDPQTGAAGKDALGYIKPIESERM